MSERQDGVTRLWVLRHAVSTFHRQGRFQGSSDDSRLTEEGHQQARRAGEVLAGIPFRAMYTSPLARAVETAGAVVAARERPLPVKVHPSLAEVQLFGWEGRRYAEICEVEPEAYGNWVHAPAQFSLDDERGVRRYPVCEAFERARGLASQFTSTHRGGDILVVTHNGMGRTLILSALGLGATAFHTIQQNNLGVSILEFPSDAGAARLRVLNATGYLQPRLPKPKSGATGIRLVLAPEMAQDGASPWLDGAQRLAACSEECGRMIAALPQPGVRPLTTVAVAGTTKELREVLASLPRLSEPLVRAAELAAGHFTVVHYAGPNSPAVLLALNFSFPDPGGSGMEFAA